jgi:ribonuclease T2
VAPVLLLLLLAGCTREQPEDYYLLSLSWSPQYCSERGQLAGDPQCDGSNEFIVHGLWPQHGRGGWPEYCSGQPLAPLSEAVIDSMLDQMPSPRLIQHQWEKHGSCDADRPERYFARVRSARARVNVPDRFIDVEKPQSLSAGAVREAFVAANPELSRDALAVICGRQHLREVRICMDKELAFRSCGADVRDRCRGTVWLRPAGTH